MLHYSTKFDGSLHYRYMTTVVEQTATMLAVYRGPGVPIESYRGSFAAKLNVLNIYWTDRHWNLSVGWYPDWVGREHYVNVASPAVWAEGVLRWIDMDLDLNWPAGASEPRLDDADEFALHRERWSYPAELAECCIRTAQEVKIAMQRREPPFDGRLYDWRPGQPLPSLEARAMLRR